MLDASRDFRWHDGERVILFAGRAALDAPAVLEREGWHGYELLTSPRALEESSRATQTAARRVLEVPAGQVPEAAAAVLELEPRGRIVALGGGRTIDVAKAVASVLGERVCAIPTTLSGAEMTRLHRPPARHAEGWEGPVRPQLVLADPEAMTSAPELLLRASAMNALAHGIESLATPRSNPLASTAALAGIRMIGEALQEPEPRARDRRGLAFGAILCAWAMDSAGYGVHHVLSQSAVRTAGSAHAATNATLLPHTVELLRGRAPEAIEHVAAALGVGAAELPARIVELGGGTGRLRDIGVDRPLVAVIARAAMRRPELQSAPEPPAESELRALLDRAW